jgi:predicted type IV restriction endonuclease
MMDIQKINARSLTLGDLRRRFGLVRSDRPLQFPEPEESNNVPALDRIKSNFDHLSQEDPPLEEVVKLVVVSPLLDLAGFYQPPFLIKAEVPTMLEIEDEPGETIHGKIDVLVIQDFLWVIAIESKPARLDVSAGIPQALTYLLSAASSQPHLYGMVTNGREVVFVELDRPSDPPQYRQSRTYQLLETVSDRTSILAVLKYIGSQASKCSPEFD